MWVKRLLKKDDQGSWKVYPTYLFTKLLGNHSFQCSTDISKLNKWMPKFYGQLFLAWDKCKVNADKDPFKIRREILWQNKNIKVRGKEMFFKEWYSNGIVLLHYILKDDGAFKSIERLIEEFNFVLKVMDYNSLKLAIPKTWKIAVKGMKIPSNAISKEEQPFFTCGNQLLALSILQNRNVYWEYISRIATTPAAALKWCREYDIDEENWKSVYNFFREIKKKQN
jgi:hypothetical protein